jgi:hypothetical protein
MVPPARGVALTVAMAARPAPGLVTLVQVHIPLGAIRVQVPAGPRLVVEAEQGGELVTRVAGTYNILYRSKDMLHHSMNA